MKYHLLVWLLTKHTHTHKQKTSAGEDVNKQKTLRPLVGIQNRTVVVKNSIVISQKLKTEYCKIQQFYTWVYNIPKMKAGSQKDVCTPVFTATLFTRAKEQKQAKCPPMNEWISKMQYIHTWWNITQSLKTNSAICYSMGEL